MRIKKLTRHECLPSESSLLPAPCPDVEATAPGVAAMIVTTSDVSQQAVPPTRPGPSVLQPPTAPGPVVAQFDPQMHGGARFCAQCGNSLNPGAAFYRSCGAATNAAGAHTVD